jgi:hypothetical protein
MNRVIKLFVATICAAFAFVGCEQTGNSGVAPTIKLIEGTVTETSISFVMGVDDAKECAYMLYDGDVTSVEEIFSKGTVVDGNGGLYTIDNLTRNTTYYIIAAARNAAGGVMSNTLVVTTKGSGGGNGGNDDNDDDFELPEIEGVENVNIVKTQDGRWYEPYNYYVTFVCDNGDRIILDFYTLDETMSQYFPYGQYSFASDYSPYTIHPDASGFVPAGKSADGEGYNFTDGYVSVDVVNGYYAIYMMLTYVVDGESKSIQGYYNGILSGASVPEGDNEGAKKLIEVLDVGSTSFQFRINAEEGQYWRCSVVDKRVYDQAQSNPGAWVVTYGFMLEGPLTFNWESGKICEHVPGLKMNVSSSTDYLILAALMDYSGGSETSLLGGVEIVQLRTNAEAVGTGTVDIKILDIGRNDVTFSCLFDKSNVWCCYVAMLETEHLEFVKQNYHMAGYNSFEECLISMIPDLSHDSMRQFLEPQESYKWEYLNYSTSYTMCVKVVDMNNGATLVMAEPFTTK